MPSETVSAFALDTDSICAKTSGAPLPKESNVAPATSSGSLSAWETLARAGQKNLSATLARTKQKKSASASCAKADATGARAMRQ